MREIPKKDEKKRDHLSRPMCSQKSVAIENCLDSSALSLHDDIRYEEATQKETRDTTPNYALPSILKHGQGVNVEVRPDCKMRDFSNTAQWNNSTPVSVDASVTPELQR